MNILKMRLIKIKILLHYHFLSPLQLWTVDSLFRHVDQHCQRKHLLTISYHRLLFFMWVRWMNTHTFCHWVSLQKIVKPNTEFKPFSSFLLQLSCIFQDSSGTFQILLIPLYFLPVLILAVEPLVSFCSSQFSLYEGLVASLPQLFLHQRQRSYFSFFHTILNA